MWSFFSRDTSKDFPFEIVDNVLGKILNHDEINFFTIFFFNIFIVLFLMTHLTMF